MFKKMYCVESHGIFVKGCTYLVDIINRYNCRVKNNGRIIYESPVFFSFEKPRIEREEELEEFDPEYYWNDEEYNDYC